MPTEHILALLMAERDKLNRAIEALQGPKRRGRPLKNRLTAPAFQEPAEPSKKQSRKFTAAQRKQQAERMRAYWAAKKNAVAKPKLKAASKARKTAKAA